MSKNRKSKRSKYFILHFMAQVLGFSFVWSIIFFVIKIISTDMAYGPMGVQNETAQAVSAYAFETMAGLWVIVLICMMGYFGRKLLLVLEGQEEEALQKKNEMLAYLAHDLRTPLTSMMGYAHLLEKMEDRNSGEAEEYLQIILSKSGLLEEMLEEFFEVTKLETGNASLQLESIDLAEMLNQITYEYIPIMQEKGLTLVPCVAGHAAVNCDVAKMERIFDNLMRNAMKYAPSESKVTVEGHVEKEKFCMCFANEAETMTEEQLTNMFEPFVRLEEARSGVEGAGMGLAITREIVELHGGKIWAEYQEGQLRIRIEIEMQALPSAE